MPWHTLAQVFNHIFAKFLAVRLACIVLATRTVAKNLLRLSRLFHSITSLSVAAAAGCVGADVAAEKAGPAGSSVPSKGDVTSPPSKYNDNVCMEGLKYDPLADVLPASHVDNSGVEAWDAVRLSRAPRFMQGSVGSLE